MGFCKLNRRRAQLFLPVRTRRGGTSTATVVEARDPQPRRVSPLSNLVVFDLSLTVRSYKTCARDEPGLELEASNGANE